MKIAITGGGTGGHLSVAKALLESALNLGLECVYIGSESGQDRAWFENEPKFSAKYFLKSRAVVSQRGLNKFKSLLNILNLSLKARKILREEKIAAIFSVGGFSAAPAAFASFLCFKPLFIHEQNSKKGSLNALLKPFCKGFFSSFEKIFAPYPVNEKFFKSQRVRTKLQTIIFLGGSQGASFINDLALNLAPSLQQKGIHIIHQCGSKDFEKCAQSYANLGIKADVFAFSNELDEKMAKADLAVARAGASTLFELCANALPAIFIPYPYAAKNHQFYNAKFLKDKNLCEMISQDGAKEHILRLIFALNLKEISASLNELIAPNGADFIIKTALSKCKFDKKRKFA